MSSVLVLAVGTGVVVIVVAVAIVLVALMVALTMQGRRHEGAERRGDAARHLDDAESRAVRAEHERDEALESGEGSPPPE